MTTVRDLGETALIERLAQAVADARLAMPTAGGFRLRLGIGDDAAAWYTGPGVLVTTTDTMVEGVHFETATTPWSDVGWKAMASSLSDVAAMGAVPLCAVVTLGLPEDLALSAVDDLYAGMLEACRRSCTALVGGDIVSSPRTFVTVALNGACEGEPLTRTSARPGDAVAVTGPLGGSAGGLRLLRQDGQADAESPLVWAHRRPEARLNEGLHLLRAGIRCAMDISDGLVTDLAKLCRASGVGAHLKAGQLPLHPGLERFGADDALQLALNGGEEYELLFAGHPAVVQRVASELPGAAVIGEVTAEGPGLVRVTDQHGAEVAVTRAGWEHLR